MAKQEIIYSFTNRKLLVQILFVSAFFFICLYRFIPTALDAPPSSISHLPSPSSIRSLGSREEQHSMIKTIKKKNVFFQHSECDVRENANEKFSNIFEKKIWVTKKDDGIVHSVSGAGSDVQLMTNWMTMLSKIIFNYNITTVCDIPCGDVNWQFGSKLLNIIDTYVGGDIVKAIIQQNQKDYEEHCNKYFVHWDLVNCPIPTHFSNKCQKTKIVEHFDLIILKDVIQHVSAKDGQKMLKNVISSGAKYLITSSYPCNKTKLQSGVKDGNWYKAGLNCPPFNLPSPKESTLSHAFKEEKDWEDDLIFFYEINDEFKSIVANWDKN